MLPVVRDVGRVLPEPLGKYLFEGSCHRRVLRDALLEKLRSVGNLLGERMANTYSLFVSPWMSSAR